MRNRLPLDMARGRRPGKDTDVRYLTALVAVGLLGVSLESQSPASVLAPTGTLRAVFLGSNPVHGREDPKTAVTTGPVPDLVAELARTLKVTPSILPAPDAAGVIAALKNGTADIGFLAFDETRAREVLYFNLARRRTESSRNFRCEARHSRRGAWALSANRDERSRHTNLRVDAEHRAGY